MHWFKIPVTDPQLRYNTELLFDCIAYRKQRESVVLNPKGPGHYTFFFFYEPVYVGDGVKLSPVPPKTSMICRPSQTRHYGTDSSKWTHSWFSFNGTYADKLLRDYDLPVGMPFNPDNEFIVEKYILQLYGEIFDSPFPDLNILKNIFHNFIIELKRSMDKKAFKEQISPSIRDVKNFIDLNFTNKITLDSLCRIASLSKSQLINLFKLHYNITPVEYIIQLRLDEAKQLLIDINLSVHDVAREVGYDDIFYFSKLFKNRFGESPSKYRKYSYKTD